MTKSCCEYCNKEYKTKKALNHHVILCEIVYKAKRRDKTTNKESDEIYEKLPSQKQMYEMLLEVTLKMTKMEEKMEQMQKWVDKTKKKINVLDWLNNSSNLKPEIEFDSLADNIHILDSDVLLLFDVDFYDTLNEIFIRNIYNKEETNIPLFSFIQKTNTIYVYNKDITSLETGWIELSREKLIYFLNKIHFKIVKTLTEWNKKNIDKINSSDKLAEIYNKAKIKLMSVDFKHDQTLSKVKFSIYNKMKKDMKSLIEYEFEF